MDAEFERSICGNTSISSNIYGSDRFRTVLNVTSLPKSRSYITQSNTPSNNKTGGVKSTVIKESKGVGISHSSDYKPSKPSMNGSIFDSDRFLAFLDDNSPRKGRSHMDRSIDWSRKDTTEIERIQVHTGSQDTRAVPHLDGIWKGVGGDAIANTNIFESDMFKSFLNQKPPHTIISEKESITLETSRANKKQNRGYISNDRGTNEQGTARKLDVSSASTSGSMHLTIATLIDKEAKHLSKMQHLLELGPEHTGQAIKLATHASYKLPFSLGKRIMHACILKHQFVQAANIFHKISELPGADNYRDGVVLSDSTRNLYVVAIRLLGQKSREQCKISTVLNMLSAIVDNGPRLHIEFEADGMYSMHSTFAKQSLPLSSPSHLPSTHLRNTIIDDGKQTTQSEYRHSHPIQALPHHRSPDNVQPQSISFETQGVMTLSQEQISSLKILSPEFEVREWSECSDTNAFNAAISSLACKDSLNTALKLKTIMQERGLVVSYESYRALIHAHGSVGNLFSAEQVFAECVNGVRENKVTMVGGPESEYKTLLGLMRVLVQGSDQRRLVHWFKRLVAYETVPITPDRVADILGLTLGYSKGIALPALMSEMSSILISKGVSERVVRDAGMEGVSSIVHNTQTYNIALQACFQGAFDFRTVGILRSYMGRYGVKVDIATCNTLMEGQLNFTDFGDKNAHEHIELRVGSGPVGRESFLSTQSGGVNSRDIDIVGLNARNGLLKRADDEEYWRTLRLYEYTRCLGIEPNVKTYSLVVQANIGMGRWADALEYVGRASTCEKRLVDGAGVGVSIKEGFDNRWDDDVLIRMVKFWSRRNASIENDPSELTKSAKFITNLLSHPKLSPSTRSFNIVLGALCRGKLSTERENVVHVLNLLDIAKERGVERNADMFTAGIIAQSQVKPRKMLEMLGLFEEMRLEGNVPDKKMNLVFLRTAINKNMHMYVVRMAEIMGKTGHRNDVGEVYSTMLQLYYDKQKWRLVDELYTEAMARNWPLDDVTHLLLKKKRKFMCTHVGVPDAGLSGELIKTRKEAARWALTEMSTIQTTPTWSRNLELIAMHTKLLDIIEPSLILPTTRYTTVAHIVVENSSPHTPSSAVTLSNTQETSPISDSPLDATDCDLKTMYGKAIENHLSLVARTGSILCSAPSQWREALSILKHLKVLFPLSPQRNTHMYRNNDISSATHPGALYLYTPNHNADALRDTVASVYESGIIACAKSGKHEYAVSLFDEMVLNLPHISPVTPPQHSDFAKWVVLSYKHLDRLHEAFEVFTERRNSTFKDRSRRMNLISTNRGVDMGKSVGGCEGERAGTNVGPHDLVMTPYRMHVNGVLLRALRESRKHSRCEALCDKLSSAALNRANPNHKALQRLHVELFLNHAAKGNWEIVMDKLEGTCMFRSEQLPLNVTQGDVDVYTQARIHAYEWPVQLSVEDSVELFGYCETSRQWNVLVSLVKHMNSNNLPVSDTQNVVFLDALFQVGKRKDASSFVQSRLGKETSVGLHRSVDLSASVAAVCVKHAAYNDVLYVYENYMVRGPVTVDQSGVSIMNDALIACAQLDTAMSGGSRTDTNVQSYVHSLSYTNNECMTRRHSENTSSTTFEIAKGIVNRLREGMKAVGGMGGAEGTQKLVAMFLERGEYNEMESLCYGLLPNFQSDLETTKDMLMVSTSDKDVCFDRDVTVATKLGLNGTIADMGIRTDKNTLVDQVMNVGTNHKEKEKIARARWVGIVVLVERMIAMNVLPPHQCLSNALAGALRLGYSEQAFKILKDLMSPIQFETHGGIVNDEDIFCTYADTDEQRHKRTYSKKGDMYKRKRMLEHAMKNLATSLVPAFCYHDTGFEGGGMDVQNPSVTTLLVPLLKSIATRTNRNTSLVHNTNASNNADANSKSPEYIDTGTKISATSVENIPLWLKPVYDVAMFVCVKLRLAPEAEQILYQMPSSIRTSVHYGQVIRACNTTNDCLRGLRAYEHMVRSGYYTDVYTYNTAMHLANKCGRSFEYTLNILQALLDSAEKGADRFKGTTMQNHWVVDSEPNESTCMALMHTFAQEGRLAEAVPFMRVIMSSDRPSLINALLSKKCKAGSSSGALTIPVYQQLVLLYQTANDLHGALAVLDHMDMDGLSPPPSIWQTLVKMCSNQNKHEMAFSMLKRMQGTGIPVDPRLHTTMIMQLGKSVNQIRAIDAETNADAFAYGGRNGVGKQVEMVQSAPVTDWRCILDMFNHVTYDLDVHTTELYGRTTLELYDEGDSERVRECEMICARGIDKQLYPNWHIYLSRARMDFHSLNRLQAKLLIRMMFRELGVRATGVDIDSLNIHLPSNCISSNSANRACLYSSVHTTSNFTPEICSRDLGGIGVRKKARDYEETMSQFSDMYVSQVLRAVRTHKRHMKIVTGGSLKRATGPVIKEVIYEELAAMQFNMKFVHKYTHGVFINNVAVMNWFDYLAKCSGYQQNQNDKRIPGA
eukprot:CFRG5120T1